MKEALEYLRDIWNITVAREIILVIATAVITHFFASRKLKNEQRIRFQDSIRTKIDCALETARDIAAEADVFEAYDDSLALAKPKDGRAFLKLAYYPAIMANKKALGEFGIKLSETRKDYEKYLDLVSVAYLDAMEKYLLSFAMYLNKNNLLDGCSTLGLLLIVDVQKWARSFDKHLTRRMNRPHYKLFTRSGWRWKLIKWYMRKKYISNTALSDLMKNTAECPIDNKSPATENEEDYVHA